MKNFKKALLASLIGLVGASGAMAASTSTTVQVNATINPVCAISATNVAFGQLTLATSGTASATGSVTSTCTKSTAYSVSINGGSSGSIASRTMAGATNGNTDALAYNLYLDSSYSTLWGDGATGGNKLTDVGNGSSQTATIFAQLPLNQFIQPDTYTDTLTVTLDY